MSDPADDRDGEVGGSTPAPSRSASAETSPGPTDEWVVSPEEGALSDVPGPLTGSPRVPWDASDDEPGVTPTTDAPTTDEPADTSAFVQMPDASLADAPEPAALRPQPVQAPAPGVDDAEPSVAVTETEPVPDPELTPFPEPLAAPAQSEPTPTAFETVTDSTFTSEPEPAVASATEPSSPGAAGTLASITAEHPEYLIAAALIGGFILAKVVKKLAA